MISPEEMDRLTDELKSFIRDELKLRLGLENVVSLKTSMEENATLKHRLADVEQNYLICKTLVEQYKSDIERLRKVIEQKEHIVLKKHAEIALLKSALENQNEEKRQG